MKYTTRYKAQTRAEDRKDLQLLDKMSKINFAFLALGLIISQIISLLLN